MPAAAAERGQLLCGGERVAVVAADLEPPAEVAEGGVAGGQEAGGLVRGELLPGPAEEFGDRGVGVGVGLADPRSGQAAEVAKSAEQVGVAQRQHDRAGAALGEPRERPGPARRLRAEPLLDGGRDVDRQVGLGVADRAVDALRVGGQAAVDVGHDQHGGDSAVLGGPGVGGGGRLAAVGPVGRVTGLTVQEHDHGQGGPLRREPRRRQVDLGLARREVGRGGRDGERHHLALGRDPAVDAVHGGERRLVPERLAEGRDVGVVRVDDAPDGEEHEQDGRRDGEQAQHRRGGAAQNPRGREDGHRTECEHDDPDGPPRRDREAAQRVDQRIIGAMIGHAARCAEGGADGELTPPTVLGTSRSPITGRARKPSAPAYRRPTRGRSVRRR